MSYMCIHIYLYKLPKKYRHICIYMMYTHVYMHVCLQDPSHVTPTATSRHTMAHERKEACHTLCESCRTYE